MKIRNIVCRKDLNQFLRFVCVGVLNTAVDFTVFTLLIKTAGIHYSIAQVCGYSSGLINSFLWNKLMTFKSRVSGKRTVIQGFQFLLVNGVSLGFTLIGLAFLIDCLQIPVLFAKVFVIGLAQLINFLCYRFIVFKDQKA